MPLKAYKIIPRSGFHFGREGLEQETTAETFSSDSFFAAFVSQAVKLFPSETIDDFLSMFPTEDNAVAPLFRTSSLLPRLGDLPLCPLPQVKINFEDLEEKRIKKLKYVSPMILNRLLRGQAMETWWNDSGDKGVLLHEGRVWIAEHELEQLPAHMQETRSSFLSEEHVWSTGAVPRVAIDRVTNNSSIFQVGRTVFAEDCGLWLMVDISDDQIDFFEEVLSFLSDAGIGGERSAGYGGFTYEDMPVPNVPTAENTARVMTLSRYNPTRTELDADVIGDGAAYRLVDVGGWMQSTGYAAQRRQRVRLIEAGSVLNNIGTITGRLVDVRPQYAQAGAPDHPVYRSGVPLLLGVEVSEDV